MRQFIKLGVLLSVLFSNLAFSQSFIDKTSPSIIPKYTLENIQKNTYESSKINQEQEEKLNISNIAIVLITPENVVKKSVSEEILSVYILAIADIVNTSFDSTNVHDLFGIQITASPKAQKFEIAYKENPNKDQLRLMNNVLTGLKQLPKLPVKQSIKFQIGFVIDTKKDSI